MNISLDWFLIGDWPERLRNQSTSKTIDKDSRKNVSWENFVERNNFLFYRQDSLKSRSAQFSIRWNDYQLNVKFSKWRNEETEKRIKNWKYSLLDISVIQITFEWIEKRSSKIIENMRSNLRLGEGYGSISQFKF